MRSVPTGQRAIPNPPTPVFQKTEGEAGRHSRLQRGQCEAPGLRWGRQQRDSC